MGPVEAPHKWEEQWLWALLCIFLCEVDRVRRKRSENDKMFVQKTDDSLHILFSLLPMCLALSLVLGSHPNCWSTRRTGRDPLSSVLSSWAETEEVQEFFFLSWSGLSYLFPLIRILPQEAVNVGFSAYMWRIVTRREVLLSLLGFQINLHLHLYCNTIVWNLARCRAVSRVLVSLMPWRHAKPVISIKKKASDVLKPFHTLHLWLLVAP